MPPNAVPKCHRSYDGHKGTRTNAYKPPCLEEHVPQCQECAEQPDVTHCRCDEDCARSAPVRPHCRPHEDPSCKKRSGRPQKSGSSRLATVDIFRCLRGEVVQIELPGVRKSDISVRVNCKAVHVSGKRFVDHPLRRDDALNIARDDITEAVRAPFQQADARSDTSSDSHDIHDDAHDADVKNNNEIKTHTEVKTLRVVSAIYHSSIPLKKCINTRAIKCISYRDGILTIRLPFLEESISRSLPVP